MTDKYPPSLLTPFMVLLWGFLGGTVTVSAQAKLDGLTFQDAVQACMEAISSGDLETAADLFQSLDSTFGKEDEYLAKEAQRRILPLKGLAELGAGRYASAADTLDVLQEAFPQTLQGNASLLYGLAQAHKGAGNRERARAVLELYVSQFSGTVEADLAYLERMDLFFLDGLTDEGLAALDQFTKSNALDSLKMQGQLKAVQAGLDAGRMKESTERMIHTPWSIASMPELAQLAFSALRCGEFSMAQGNYGDALKLFQLVPPKSQLIRLQREKLDELGTRILSGRRRALLATHRHQQSYLTMLQQQLTQQLEALENSEDYTPIFYLHYGQSLLFDSQFYKSWLVFEYISLNDNYPREVREEAHYRWVVCAHQLADWEEALTIARNFVDRYPESQLAPQALYLIAKAHLEQRRYPESIEVLSDLINDFPDHPLHGRWLFTRGFNQVVLEAYEDARADFNSYTSKHPQGQLAVNARLWNALTYFFERNYAICIEELCELGKLDTRHPLYPEILYRLASTYYSARDYEEALKTISEYIGNFSRHQRIDEARVLQGDILMGHGELDSARASFETVSVEMPELYLYSLFQTGKILRAQEDYPGMADHFQSFLENETSPKIRVSEALYWLGWAYQQEERIDLAYPVFENALARYGNDPTAAETQSILQALEKLKNRQAAGPIDRGSPLVSAEDFKSWLTKEMVKAEEDQRLTYLSRLVLYQNSRYKKEEGGGSSLLRLAEIVPMEQLDPEALGKIGLALLEQGNSQAQLFFSFLVESFPRSNARAMGYLGLAQLANGAKEFDAAKGWLSKSSEQIPVHPHMNESQLLMGQVLSKLNEYDAAIETYENLLRLKSARGRPHATALTGIAEVYQVQGNTDKAIAYYQRIYNMYRAYPDLVAAAYLKSSALFESLNRIPEAVGTLEEMLNQAYLSEYPEWETAEIKRAALLPRIPEAIKMNPPATSDETP